jgi:hypothetical protein
VEEIGHAVPLSEERLERRSYAQPPAQRQGRIGCFEREEVSGNFNQHGRSGINYRC